MQCHRDRRGEDVCAHKPRDADSHQCFESHKWSKSKEHPYSHSQSYRVLRVL